jgi:hypothetical protein
MSPKADRPRRPSPISPRYLLRFFLWSAVAFVAYRPLVPALAVVLTAPAAVLVAPLQAVPRGDAVRFEWQRPGVMTAFTEVHFEPLCSNLVVLAGLVLALDWPLRRRLRALGLGLPSLLALNELYLGVILLQSYHETIGGRQLGGIGAIFWGIVKIAYYLGQQMGTMVAPLLVFLFLTLRPAGRPDGSKTAERGAAG